jgi:CDP-2,3-bis-(O-geranylgeranyl)-sn-glycerol synthase
MMPAYFANMAPVIFKNNFKKLAIPVEKNIFGKNKTYRGLIVGILFAMLIAYLQSILYQSNLFKALSFINYSNWLLIGFLFGFGALFGDLIESLIKRRLKIKPGKKFVPWDQLDFVFGALILISFSINLAFKMVSTIIIISIIGHILVNHLAYYLKIRKEKW